MLFDLKFFHRLKLLQVITKRHFRGQRIGHRKSPNRGSSAEFAEYRKYFPGDDLRFIDWNLYSRLNKLYIKKFHNEEELTVSILLDCSKSMGSGKPQKFDHARKLAAAIAYIALQHQDQARIHCFANVLDPLSEGAARTSHIHKLMGYLEEKNTDGGPGNFEDVVRRFLVKTRRPGVVFILSDGFLGPNLRAGIKRLAHRRFEVTLVQILSPQELEPDMAGLVELTDSESGKKTTLTVTNDVLLIYKEVLQESIDDLRSFCYRHGGGYKQCLSSTPFESTLLQLFGQGRGKK